MTIPSSLTEIGNSAFKGCSSLTQITIPSSVTSIGNYAFSKCLKLTQITIPSSVTEVGKNIFMGCPLISAETIETINKIKSSTNNNINNKITTWVTNSSNIKPTWKWNNNTSNNNTSSLSINSNNASFLGNNKPHTNKWSNFGEKNINKQYAWNPNTNISNKNAFEWGTNKDKKGNCLTSNNNSALENENDQKKKKEFEIMKMLDHPNVLKAIDITYDNKNHPSILFEECSTNLYQAIQNKFFSKVYSIYPLFQ